MVLVNLPRSCYCISLRTGSIVIGVTTLALTCLLFTHALVYTILRGWRWSPPNPLWKDVTMDIFRVLKTEYALCIQLMFACYLLYGLFMGKSWFVFSWVVLQASALSAVIINSIIYLFVYGIMFDDDLVTIVLLLFVIGTVYGYYIYQPDATLAFIV